MKKKYPDPILRRLPCKGRGKGKGPACKRKVCKKGIDCKGPAGNYFFWYTEADKTRSKVSTGFGTGEKEEAREFIRQYVDRKSGGLSNSFRNYSDPFFIIETCPRIKRLRQEGKTIGETHIRKSRSWLNRHILTDHFADIPLNEIRRADVLDLRSRLLKIGNGNNTVNKCLNVVKTILSEAAYRQDLAYNPAAEIGKLNYEQEEKTKLDFFELQQILSYASNPIGWQVYAIEKEILSSNHQNFKEALQTTIKERLTISIPKAEAAKREVLTGLLISFFACSGCRVGEVRALKWNAIDLKTGRVKIDQAFKSEKELGLPKWNKIREIVLSPSLLSQINKWYETTYYNNPDNFVFPTADGFSVGITWIRKNFLKFFKRIDEDENSEFKIDNRQLTPHVFRHSLNTNLLAAEVSPLLVQTFLGWSSDEQKILTKVQKGYTGLELLRLETVSETIENIYFSKKIKQIKEA